MSDEATLIEFPDIKTLARRGWPRLANRAAICLALPFFAAMLASTLDLLGPISQLALPLGFLDVGPFPYEAKEVAFIVLALLAGALLAGERATQLVLALATSALLWAGFEFTRLRWTKLFLPNYDPLQQVTPSIGAWVWAALILVAALAFVLVESHLDMRAHLARRLVPDAEASPAARAGAESLALAVGAGLVGALLLGLAFWAIRPLLAAWSLHVNPVFALFALGVVAAAGIVLAARRQSILKR